MEKEMIYTVTVADASTSHPLRGILHWSDVEDPFELTPGYHPRKTFLSEQTDFRDSNHVKSYVNGILVGMNILDHTARPHIKIRFDQSVIDRFGINFHAVLIDETGCEFGATVRAMDKEEARRKIEESYSESRCVQLESPEDTMERERRIYDHISRGGDYDDDGRPIYHYYDYDD